MHFGRLPVALVDHLPTAPTVPRRVMTRRGFASIVVTATATLGLSWWLVRGRRGKLVNPAAATVASDASVAIPRRGTVDWALALGNADGDVLLAAAGDLERVAARFSRDPRLIPVFNRLLDSALLSGVGFADSAAACAIRSLVLLDGADHLQVRHGAIVQRRDFDRAQRELADALAAPRGDARR